MARPLFFICGKGVEVWNKKRRKVRVCLDCCFWNCVVAHHILGQTVILLILFHKAPSSPATVCPGEEDFMRKTQKETGSVPLEMVVYLPTVEL